METQQDLLPAVCSLLNLSSSYSQLSPNPNESCNTLKETIITSLKCKVITLLQKKLNVRERGPSILAKHVIPKYVTRNEIQSELHMLFFPFLAYNQISVRNNRKQNGIILETFINMCIKGCAIVIIISPRQVLSQTQLLN